MPQRSSPADADHHGPESGVRAEFAPLFQESYRSFWLIASGILRDRSLADDVVQEAAIIGLGKFDQYQPGSSFRSWMGQIVRYSALNHMRKERTRRMTSVDGMSTELASHEGASKAARPDDPVNTRSYTRLELSELDNLVLSALDQVSETARACLLLRTIEGLEYTQIAELLSIPKGTAMSHVHRTRQLLRERLGRATSEGTSIGGRSA